FHHCISTDEKLRSSCVWLVSIVQERKPWRGEDLGQFVPRLAFSDDCKHFACTSPGGNICIYDANTSRRIRQIHFDSRDRVVQSLAFSRSGMLAVAYKRQAQLEILDVNTSARPRVIELQQHYHPLGRIWGNHLAFFPRNDRLLCAVNNQIHVIST